MESKDCQIQYGKQSQRTTTYMEQDMFYMLVFIYTATSEKNITVSIFIIQNFQTFYNK